MSATAGAPTWVAGGHSSMGARHMQAELPNQDAIAWWANGEATVLAVSDGHGAPSHFRSEVGAQLAVRAAVDALKEVVSGATAVGPTADAKLWRKIIESWRAAVLEHAEAHPWGTRERFFFSTRDPFVPYGATLIATAARSGSGVLALQLGDGDLVLGTADGALVRPLPDDVGLSGESTYSLCMPDALEFVRMQFLPASTKDVDFAMLSTDGLAKSLGGVRALGLQAADWRELISREGLDSAVRELERVLPDISLRGNGDDITVGFLARTPAVRGQA